MDEFTLAAYRDLLQLALDNGYEFLHFDRIGAEAGERSCLLRHDIDSELLSCGPMLDIEQSLGITATYFVMTRSTAYNPFSVEGRRMIERIIGDGHALGLHFMGELCEGDDAAAIADKVSVEKTWLEREFGAPVTAVSFHQPTRAILDGQIEVPGMRNTYNKSQTEPYFYISDTNMNWRHEPPTEIFSKAIYPRLQLLIHPMWWTDTTLDVRRKWLAVLRTNKRAVVDHWQEREGTLKDMHLLNENE